MNRWKTRSSSLATYLSTWASNFLTRDTNKAFAKVVGDKVNRGAGYGLDMPRIHSLCYIEVLKSTLRASVLSEIKKCPFLGGTIIQRYMYRLTHGL